MTRPATLLAGLLLSLTLAGPAHARPAHEWAGPDHGPARGVMIVIHGGGGLGGPHLMPSMLPTAQRFNRWGWRTLNIDYRSGLPGIDDVVAFYDLTRRRYPRLPVCAVGSSAGGTRALMLAVLRPRLDCVISEEGASDVTAVWDGQTIPPIQGTVRHLYTRPQTRKISAAGRLGRYHGRLLATYSTADICVRGQVEGPLLRRLRSPKRRIMRVHGVSSVDRAGITQPLPSGYEPFTHLHLPVSEARAYRAAQLQTVRAVERDRRR